MAVDYTLITQNYSATLAAHAITQRTVYAVPAGRSALLTHVFAQITNGNGNAANSGDIYIQLFDSSVAALVPIACVAMPAGNVPAVLVCPCTFYLDELDEIRGYTLQSSALNSQYLFTVQIAEY